MVNPNIIIEVQNLESIHGEITAELVFKAGKKPGTAIYEYLKARDVFDKDKAQYHWGIQVCRELIRNIKIEVHNTEYELKVPKYVKNPELPPNIPGMVNVTKLNNTAKRDALIPYLQRAISNIISAIGLSEGTGCKEYLEGCLEQVQHSVELIQKHKVKATRIERKKRINGTHHAELR